MKRISQPILIGVLMLILLNSACTALAGTSPTPPGTILPDGQTQLPAPTSTVLAATNTPLTPVIPITGENVVEMQCQFCVNDLTHAVFVFPDFAIFDVESSTPVTCLTAEVVNGKRVLVCYGTQLTTFNLKICSDSSNCLLFPVALQACPLLATTGTPSTPMTPIFLTAINTLKVPTATHIDSTPVPSQAATTPPPATATTESTPTPTPPSYP